MPGKNTPETGLEYEILYAQMSVVTTTAIQAHTYQPSGESHSCLTGIRQEDILGSKTSGAYSVFGSSPSANKSGNVIYICPLVS